MQTIYFDNMEEREDEDELTPEELQEKADRAREAMEEDSVRDPNLE
jgi:hypothetical protein